ncbi:MAG: 4-hydroxybutyrate CoA-transferase, partial [Oscillospiraceae bacterium]
MMDWNTYYKEHLMTAEAAVLKMPKNANIATSHAAAEPRLILDTMTKNREYFKDAKIFSVILMGETSYCAPCCDGHIRYQTMFVSAGSRVAVAENRADFIPCFYHDVPALIKNHLKPNVAIVSVSPPDVHGYCSLGLTCDYQRAAIDTADLVIAEVNRQLPYVMGDNFVHVTEIDCIVEADEGLPILAKGKIGDAEKAIGENCAKLISDGDTLQLGIGGIPDAVLMA